MSILVVSPGRDPKVWVRELRLRLPDEEIYAWTEDLQIDKEKVDFAVSWKHPFGIYSEYPNLKVISSMGAGVDHITGDPAISRDITVTRIVDEQLTVDMSAFVLALIMSYLKNISYHHCNNTWEPKKYLRIEDAHIGILGLGTLGGGLAELLRKNDFKISGWSNSEKQRDGVSAFYGRDQLPEFLETVNILVCLLPLTPETEGILNKDLFKKLPKGAYVINVARGEHLVEEDLLEMVQQGHLSGASLDVFRKEPLPDDHPFWKEPKIMITPHIASITDPRKVVPQVAENYRRLQKGEDLKNVVPREKGY